MRVLVCDDDPAMLHVISRTIAKAGHEVVQAADGHRAWEALQDGSIQLAVLDWEVPGPNAIEICERLKRHRKCQTIYVIVLTGRASPEAVSLALGAGASDFVTKPFSGEELIARLSMGQRTVQMQSELVHAQKLEAVGQLAAGIAHEINTPLQYVGDNTEYLRKAFDRMTEVFEQYQSILKAANSDSITPELVAEVEDAVKKARVTSLMEQIPEAIEDALDGIETVAKLVRAMKEFSHPGTDEKTNVDINRAIETTITVAKNEWKYVADVETDLDADLPVVPGLPGELNQVFLNLLVNAAHAIADVVGDGANGKGKITFSTRSAGDWAEIRIEDTGGGIPETIRSRIFEPFFTTKELGKGTGQGLAIAHAVIVQKHGGKICVKTKPGEGTTFFIKLPLETKSRPETSENTLAEVAAS